MSALSHRDAASRPPLLACKRAIVTGAWGGIGAGIVRGLLAEGAVVAGIGHSAPQAAGSQAELGLEAVIVAGPREA